MLIPANILILLFLVSCSKGVSNSLTLSAGTIILWCFIVFLICALITFFYLKSHVSNLPGNEKGLKGYGIIFTQKFYEIIGFGVSAFALAFAIFSMINSEKLDSGQLKRPIFEVTAVKYKFSWRLGVGPRQLIDIIKLCPKNTSFFGLRASFLISKWAF